MESKSVLGKSNLENLRTLFGSIVTTYIRELEDAEKVRIQKLEKSKKKRRRGDKDPEEQQQKSKKLYEHFTKNGKIIMEKAWNEIKNQEEQKEKDKLQAEDEAFKKEQEKLEIKIKEIKTAFLEDGRKLIQMRKEVPETCENYLLELFQQQDRELEAKETKQDRSVVKMPTTSDIQRLLTVRQEIEAETDSLTGLLIDQIQNIEALNQYIQEVKVKGPSSVEQAIAQEIPTNEHKQSNFDLENVDRTQDFDLTRTINVPPISLLSSSSSSSSSSSISAMPPPPPRFSVLPTSSSLRQSLSFSPTRER